MKKLSAKRFKTRIETRVFANIEYECKNIKPKIR